MIDNKREIEFNRKIREELDASLDRLDPVVEKRLLSSRLRALNQPERNWRELFRMPRMLTVTGFVVAAVMILSVSLWYTARPQLTASRAVDLEVLTIATSLDMYKNLDMLQWLVESDEKS